VDLLKGRVATDRENEALHSLIACAIASSRWVTAQEVLSSISQELQDRDWFRKAEAILAINTGDQSCPN
jgi:thioredoxin-like negative regulator of GroEL